MLKHKNTKINQGRHELWSKFNESTTDMPYTCTLGNSKKFSMMTSYLSFMQQLIHEVTPSKLSMIKCYFLIWMMNQYLNIEHTPITSMVNTTYHLLQVHVINYDRTLQPMTLNTEPIDTCRKTQHMLILAKKITWYVAKWQLPKRRHVNTMT